MKNETNARVGCAANDRAISAPDTTRRDALARNLAVRVCDGRFDVDDLLVIDRVLDLLRDIDDGHALTPLFERLRNDRYSLDDAENLIELGKRHSWNACSVHCEALLLACEAIPPLPVVKVPADVDPAILDGLRELVANAPEPAERGFDR